MDAQPTSGDGVRTREQGHLVAQSDQLIRKIGNDSLGPAIKPPRNTLPKRRDLRNFPVFSLQGNRMWRQLRREGQAVSV
jgi:hypothetical protein